jgi:superfamily II DNA helicase RecQ
MIPLLLNKTDFSNKIKVLLSQIFVKSNQSKIKNFIESGFNSKYQPNINEMLEAFRTEMAEKHRVPKGKIFSEKVINIITKEKPSSLIDLENLEILTLYQFNSYGDEIIKIVQDFLENKGN